MSYSYDSQVLKIFKFANVSWDRPGHWIIVTRSLHRAVHVPVSQCWGLGGPGELFGKEVFFFFGACVVKFRMNLQLRAVQRISNASFPRRVVLNQHAVSTVH